LVCLLLILLLSSYEKAVAAGAEMESLDNEGIFLTAADSVSGSYLVWQGDTVGGNGNDLYAAFVGPNLPFSVYVPLAVR
jgi:hypothetical protein